MKELVTAYFDKILHLVQLAERFQKHPENDDLALAMVKKGMDVVVGGIWFQKELENSSASCGKLLEAAGKRNPKLKEAVQAYWNELKKRSLAAGFISEIEINHVIESLVASCKL